MNATIAESNNIKKSELNEGRKRKSAEPNDISGGKKSKKAKVKNVNHTDINVMFTESTSSQSLKKPKKGLSHFNGEEIDVQESEVETEKPKKGKKKKAAKILDENSQDEPNIDPSNNNTDEYEDRKITRGKKHVENDELQTTDFESDSSTKKRKKKNISKEPNLENTHDILNVLNNLKQDSDEISGAMQDRKKSPKKSKNTTAVSEESRDPKRSKRKSKGVKKNESNNVEDEDAKNLTREVNIIDIKSEQNNGDNENIVHISIKDSNVNSEENDLLKQLENKLTTSPEKKTVSGVTWPISDLQELISRMQVFVPPNDTLTFMKRLELLQWDAIAFKNYTAEQCKNTWMKLQKRVRKYRILEEILKDAKVLTETKIIKRGKQKVKRIQAPRHPDMPRKPLTAYFLYYMEHRDAYQKEHPGTDASVVSKVLAQQFTSLPPDLKKKYDETAAKNLAEYKRKMSEFYENHPEIPRITPKQKSTKTVKPLKVKAAPKPKDKLPTKPHSPFLYFYLAECEKENVEDKTKFKEMCKERWKLLPESIKLIWIQHAESAVAQYKKELEEYAKRHPEYTKATKKVQILSREEVLIKEKAAGKPQKPPTNAYNLFVKKVVPGDRVREGNIKDRLTYASEQWKNCSEEEKNQIREEYNQLKLKYQEEFDAYLQTLSEEDRQKELSQLTKKEVLEDKKLKTKTKKRVPSKKTVTKKAASLPEKLKEPEQPPISPYKYFASIYNGVEPVSQAWKSLTKEQKRFYEEELDKKKRVYIQEFEKFLKSLSEEELAAFSLSRKRIKQEQENNKSDDTDSESEEDGSSSEDSDD